MSLYWRSGSRFIFLKAITSPPDRLAAKKILENEREKKKKLSSSRDLVWILIVHAGISFYLFFRSCFLYFDCSDLNELRREHKILEGELQTLRETYNLRQDTWIKEKLAMQVSVDAPTC